MSLSRRRFLQASATAAGVSVLNLSSFSAFAGMFNDCNQIGYKAIVGIDFAGGNDGFNMIFPKETAKYGDYLALRGALSAPHGTGVDLDGEFQLNSVMEELWFLWEEKELLPILNVGPLVKRVTKDTVTNEENIPAHLFSHNHQSAMVQSNSGTKLTKQGFGANGEKTMAASRSDLGEYAPLFDVSSSQTWTNNLDLQSNNVGTSAPKDIFLKEAVRDRTLFDKLQNKNRYNNTFLKHYANVATGAPVMHETFSKIFEPDLTMNRLFPDTHIGKQLEAVLKLIVNREQFGHQRQYFSCQIGGFDTHSNQHDRQLPLLKEYSDAITIFHQQLRVLGLKDSVTSFTHSEFGRTLIPNATNGTDHGWGSHSFVIGGAVDGKKIYGEFPDIQPDSDLLMSRGRVIPTISTDQIHATLLTWLGLSEGKVTELFPALSDPSFKDKTLDLFRCA